MMRSDGRPLVALQVPQGPRFRAALEAEWATGAAVLPLPVDLPDPELRTVLERMRPERLVTPDARTELPEGSPVTPETALVVLTSGSTGAPKGVELARAAVQAAARMTTERLGAEPGDRWLCCVPVTKIAGLSILFRSDLLSTEPVVLERFDVDSVTSDDTCSFISLVPTMLHRLLEAGAELRRWKAILLGGAPPPPRLVARAEASGARVIRTYGMTETCGGVVYDGQPLHGVDVKVDADGAIQLRAPSLMLRYRLDPDLTARTLQGGWYRTGDIGTFADGRLTVLGRADDAIVTGGEKVFPSEVEQALLSHPGIEAAGVSSEPDEEWGHRVVARVVTELSPEEVRKFLKELLARHKVPARIDIVEET